VLIRFVDTYINMHMHPFGYLIILMIKCTLWKIIQNNIKNITRLHTVLGRLHNIVVYY